MKITIPGLDGFRAIAFLLVFFFHENLLGFGWAGVPMFFVLSGFLITGILAESQNDSLSAYLKSFYCRRALRIFPLYYGYLLVIGVASLYLARRDLAIARAVLDQLPYAATYTYNFFHASSRFVPNASLTHFWSLAVEEQFYLLWPLVVFVTSRKTLPRMLALMVVSGPLLRALTGFALRSGWVPGATENVSMALYVLPWCQVDAFAAGGLLNFVTVPCHRRLGFVALASVPVVGLASTWLATGRVGAVSELGFPLFMNEASKPLWGYTFIAVVSAIVLYSISKRSFFPRFFENPALAYMGKISYGLYVIHFPVLLVTGTVCARLHVALPVVAKLSLDLALTAALAAMSFHVFERRFLAMKDRFPSRSVRPTVVPAALTEA